MAHDDALVERFVHGHGQTPSKFGQSDQQQAQAVFGVHLIVGEQAQLFEHVVAQMMGFIDEQYRLLLGFGHQACDLFADGPRCTGAVALCG